MDLTGLVDFISSVGLPTALILGAGLFIDRRVWPWFIREFWPHRQKQSERQNELLSEIRDALATIRTLDESTRQQDLIASSVLQNLMGLTQRIFDRLEESPKWRDIHGFGSTGFIPVPSPDENTSMKEG